MRREAAFHSIPSQTSKAFHMPSYEEHDWEELIRLRNVGISSLSPSLELFEVFSTGRHLLVEGHGLAERNHFLDAFQNLVFYCHVNLQ